MTQLTLSNLFAIICVLSVNNDDDRIYVEMGTACWWRVEKTKLQHILLDIFAKCNVPVFWDALFTMRHTLTSAVHIKTVGLRPFWQVCKCNNQRHAADVNDILLAIFITKIIYCHLLPRGEYCCRHHGFIVATWLLDSVPRTRTTAETAFNCLPLLLPFLYTSHYLHNLYNAKLNYYSSIL